MKTLVKLSNLLAFIFLLSSCGGKKQEPTQEQTAAPSDLMAEAPVYDATKIDPNAAIQTIKLNDSLTYCHYNLVSHYHRKQNCSIRESSLWNP